MRMSRLIDVIDDHISRKQLTVPSPLILIDSVTGQIYRGEILVISPTSMAIKTDAPWNSTYWAYLFQNLKVLISGIPGRKWQSVYGFEIRYVFRQGSWETGQLSNEEYIDLFGDSGKLVEILQNEHRVKAYENQILRDILSLYTKKRFALINEEEMSRLITAGKTILTGRVQKALDIRQIRNNIEQRLRHLFMMSPKEIYQFLLCCSEALSNILKHAKEGRFHINIEDNLIRFCAIDSGPGISLEDLPKASIRDNLARKGSLGTGLKIMLQHTDRIYLCTGPSGTQIVLENTAIPHEPEIQKNIV